MLRTGCFPRSSRMIDVGARRVRHAALIAWCALPLASSEQGSGPHWCGASGPRVVSGATGARVCGVSCDTRARARRWRRVRKKSERGPLSHYPRGTARPSTSLPIPLYSSPSRPASAPLRSSLSRSVSNLRFNARVRTLLSRLREQNYLQLARLQNFLTVTRASAARSEGLPHTMGHPAWGGAAFCHADG